jgi:AcrR family transcriptional regulator
MPTTGAVRKRVTAPERRRLLLDAAGRVFAARGYQAATVDAIAGEAGVTVPVLYDHFRSKAGLYAELVDVNYQSLREIWFGHASRGEPLEAWLGPAVDDWYGYLEVHPFARRMLFLESTGDPVAADAHRRIQEDSRIAVTSLLRLEADRAGIDLGDDTGVELTWETLRAVLQGLAVWWHDHPEVPRARIVQAALDALWLGVGGVMAGRRWGDPG